MKKKIAFGVVFVFLSQSANADHLKTKETAYLGAMKEKNLYTKNKFKKIINEKLMGQQRTLEHCVAGEIDQMRPAVADPNLYAQMNDLHQEIKKDSKKALSLIRMKEIYHQLLFIHKTATDLCSDGFDEYIAYYEGIEQALAESKDTKIIDNEEKKRLRDSYAHEVKKAKKSAYQNYKSEVKGLKRGFWGDARHWKHDAEKTRTLKIKSENDLGLAESDCHKIIKEIDLNEAEFNRQLDQNKTPNEMLWPKEPEKADIMPGPKPQNGP